MKPHPVPREDRGGTYCEDYELNGCSVDGCPERCYLALPNPDQPMTAAEFLFVSALCQFYNPYPGPIAWLCRYAWIAYQTLGADTDIEIDNVIARQADWLNRPENSTTRTNLINSITWLRHMAAKPPHWPLPDQSAFDASQWLNTGHGSYATAAGTEPNDGKTPHNPRWTFSGPGSFTVQAIPTDLTVKCEQWKPAAYVDQIADVRFEPRYVAALLDPHYVTCIALMADATDILGPPHATYIGPSGVHWQPTEPPTSLLNSPAAELPWQCYEHSDVEWTEQ